VLGDRDDLDFDAGGAFLEGIHDVGAAECLREGRMRVFFDKGYKERDI
jgi:hypothetical protein